MGFVSSVCITQSWSQVVSRELPLTGLLASLFPQYKSMVRFVCDHVILAKILRSIKDNVLRGFLGLGRRYIPHSLIDFSYLPAHWSHRGRDGSRCTSPRLRERYIERLSGPRQLHGLDGVEIIPKRDKFPLCSTAQC